MFKHFYTFRYSLSANGRHNTLLVYAASIDFATEKAEARLRADYQNGFTLFSQGRQTFATAEEADKACSNGFFDSISQCELAEFFEDYLEANPVAIKARVPSSRSSFARELDKRARDFQHQKAAIA